MTRLLVIIFLLFGCNFNNIPSDYDFRILSEGANSLSSIDTLEKEYTSFTVSPSENAVSFEIEGGTEFVINLAGDSAPSPVMLYDISEVGKNYADLISSSQELINSYINSSSILKEKEEIKKYIFSLPIKEVTCNEEMVAAFSPKDGGTVYLNRVYADSICEWALVHEFVHAICFYTHGCDVFSEEYGFSLFNEILTDIITSSMEPENESVQSGYSPYYDVVYPYIGLVGASAIEAYFYNYDTIYQKIPKEEMDLWVTLIDIMENEDNSENAKMLHELFLQKWFYLLQPKTKEMAVPSL